MARATEAGLRDVINRIVKKVRDSDIAQRMVERVTRYFQTQNPVDDLTPQEVSYLYRGDEYGDEFDVKGDRELDVEWTQHAEYRSDLRDIQPSLVNEAVRDFADNHSGMGGHKKVKLIKPGVGKAIVDIDMTKEPEEAAVVTVMAKMTAMNKRLVGIAERVAIDFTTQDAFDTYMKEHPEGDRRNHRVVETKKEPSRDKPELKGEKGKPFDVGIIQKYEPAPLPKSFHNILRQIFDAAKKVVKKVKGPEDLVKELNNKLGDFKIYVVQDEDMDGKWEGNVFSRGDRMKDGRVRLTINNDTVKAFKDGDTEVIADSIIELVTHEFSHIEQFAKGKQTEQMKEIGNSQYWKPLEEVVNSKNQEQFERRMQDMIGHIEDGKDEPKWVKDEGLKVDEIKKQMREKYFFNASEFPSYALSATLEIINKLKKKHNEKGVRGEIGKLTPKNYTDYATKGSTLERYDKWKMPKEAVEVLVGLIRKTAEGLDSSYFEQWS